MRWRRFVPHPRIGSTAVLFAIREFLSHGVGSRPTRMDGIFSSGLSMNEGNGLLDVEHVDVHNDQFGRHRISA